MAQFGKFTLKDTLKIHSAFKGLYGVGRTKSWAMHRFSGLRHGQKLKHVNSEFTDHFVSEPMRVEQDLRTPLYRWIKRGFLAGTYKARRKAESLPSRGQRTHTNAKTLKTLKRLGKDMPMKVAEKKHVIKARELARQQRAAAAKKAQRKAKNKSKTKAKAKGKTKGKKK